MEEKSRIVTLDIAKGIGIILVVIGHCYSKYTKTEGLIYGFHMSLFFMISGIVYGKRNKKYSFDMKKKIKNLIIPYLFFEFMWFFCLFINNFNNPEWNGKEILMNVISFRGNIATWYLPCLFLTEFYFWLCLQINKPKITMTLLFLLGLMLPSKFNPSLLVFIRPLVALGFFGMGYFGFYIFEKVQNRILITILIAIYIVITLKNGLILFYVRQFNNLLLFISSSLIGSYLILQLSNYIARKSITSKVLKKVSSNLSYFGKNSLFIMCVHMFFVPFIRTLVYKIFGNSFFLFGEFEGLFLGLFVFISCLLFVPIFNKYCFFLIGKKPIE